MAHTPEQVRQTLIARLVLGGDQKACDYVEQEHGFTVDRSTVSRWRTQIHAQLYHELSAEHQQRIAEATAAEAENVIRKAADLEQRLLDKLEQGMDNLDPKDIAGALRNVSTTKALNLDKIASPLRGRPTAVIQHESAETILRRLAPYLSQQNTVEGTAVEETPAIEEHTTPEEPTTPG